MLQVRIDVERIRLAVGDAEGLVPVLKPPGDVDRRIAAGVKGPGHVEIQHPIGLGVGAGVVVGVDVVTLAEQLRIDGVVDVEAGPAPARSRAQVIVPAAVAQVAAHAARQRVVGDEAAELRREAARELLVQCVAVGVRADGGQRVGVGHVAADRYRRAVAGAVAGQVGDPYRAQAAVDEVLRNNREVFVGAGGFPVAVSPSVIFILKHGAAVGINFGTGEDAAASVRITIVEAALHLPLGPVAEGVGLAAVAEIDAEVAEQLVVAGNLGLTPDLRGGGAHVGVAGVDQALSVRTLRAAAGGILLPSTRS